MLARSVIVAVAVAGVGCVATSDTSQEELGKTSQELSFVPIIPYFPPSWVTPCPAGSPLEGWASYRYFVRRATACSSVVRTNGTWVGERLFNEGSHWCAYRWTGSSLPTASEYWSLDGVAEAVPALATGPGAINPKIIPNCMLYPTCTSSYSCPSVPTTSCTDGGSCITPIKTVNPCGTCGVMSGGRIATVVPYDWIQDRLVVDVWPKSGYGPTRNQAFEIIPPSYAGRVADGTNMVIVDYD